MILNIKHSNNNNKTIDDQYISSESIYIANYNDTFKESAKYKFLPDYHTKNAEDDFNRNTNYFLPDYGIIFQKAFLMNGNGKTIRIYG